MILEIKKFAGGYGSKVILNNIDLDVEKGEFIGIIGPNGSGKTTLLKAITKLVKPWEGTIRFEGRDIQEKTFKELAKTIAVVSQGVPGTEMTIEEYVLLGRIPHYGRFQFYESEHDLAISGRSMEMTNIIHLKDRYLSEISSGELQLALIARALTQEPALLLLDEPTAHLDITHQVAILDLIRKLKREYSLTIIIVLHDLNLAAEYCDRLVLMDKGTIKNTGRPEDVLNYRDIEDVYKTVVVVESNPLTSKPFVLIVSEEVKNRCRK
ncbi:MAG: ABC transporter ATP-binding protein [Proteobacteria bacterium]|nr:ABC transporter ATP-binding protein [Pseudomonadota bacterium]